MSDPDARLFVLTPHVGVSGVAFGACQAEVAAAWGAPSAVRSSRGWTFLSYPGCEVGLAEARSVQQVSFFPGESTVELNGERVLTSTSEGPQLTLPRLLAWDPAPRVDVGFLVFFALGVWTTGFHDHDPAQRSFGAFRPGLFDSMRNAHVWAPK